MTPRPLTTIVAIVALGATVFVGLRGVGAAPPLGALLDPAHGVWRPSAPATSGSVVIPGLSAPVSVRYDARGVPHVFARTELDAYRALGYVVARDRLFQLELQTRAGEGRLTGLVGSAALQMDRETRRLGMARAVERKYAALDPASPSRAMMQAYADGVNAWIDALSPAQYPVEYKLLNARPERWRPVNTVALLERMSWTLASGAPERALVRAGARARARGRRGGNAGRRGGLPAAHADPGAHPAGAGMDGAARPVRAHPAAGRTRQRDDRARAGVRSLSRSR